MLSSSIERVPERRQSGAPRDQPAVGTQEEPLEAGHRGLEIRHADGHPLPGAGPAQLDGVRVPALLDLLPHELAEASREPGLAGEHAGHPVLAPAAVAGAEQGGQRQEGGAGPVDEAERTRVVAVEALGGGAVGHHRAHGEHQGHHHERSGDHDQEVTPGAPKANTAADPNTAEVGAGPAVQVGAKQLSPAAVRVRRGEGHAVPQKATRGTARSAATSISKKSRVRKDIGPAISSVGNTWTRVL